MPCDGGLALDSSDPADAAAAIGICEGLQSAEWLLPDGDPLPMGGAIGRGLLPDFGPNVAPHEGNALLVLSTGAARAADDPGFVIGNQFNKGYSHGVPAGFPAAPPAGCPDPAAGANDGIALDVTVQAPAGVGGFSFDWTFYTHEFPEYVCTEFVDAAAALVDDVNILFGPDLLAVGTNSPMEVCTASPQAPNSLCSQGTSQLVGTGFDFMSVDLAGATGWQTTSHAVTGGTTYTVRFAVWDTGDHVWDSTILFDNFRWFGDGDGDLVPDDSDNCPTVANALGQAADADGDLAGDACDAPGTGNVDCNGAINSVDALKILRFNTALSVTQNEPCLDLGQPLASTFGHGDVDCSGGNTNAVDALKVLRAVALLPAVTSCAGPIIGP